MSDDSDDKQHAPSGRRLDELRQSGTVLRSKDFSGAIIFGIVLMLIALISTKIMDNFKFIFHLSFESFGNAVVSQDAIIEIIRTVSLRTFYILLPIYVIALIVTILTPFLLGGWNFTLAVFNFDLGKLDMMANLSRMFSPKQAILEIAKSFLKSLVFLAALVFFIIANKTLIINYINQPVIAAIYGCVDLIKEFMVTLVAAIIIVVTFDIYYNLMQYHQKSRMSTQEVRDQSKDADGSPELKSKIRSRQMSLMKQRIRQDVPLANVIITNPTHYAVALKYNGAKDKAPRVIAKGKDVMAFQIRQIAIAHAVTVYEAPELARAIYHTAKIGESIHPALYKAVAIVLTYVHQLKNYQMGNATLPQFASNLEIPSEFIFKE